MNYIFVLAHGDLSLGELARHFESHDIPFEILGNNQRVALVSMGDSGPRQLIASLGGIYKMGQLVCSLERNAIRRHALDATLDAAQFFDWLPEKILWGISVYGELTRREIEFLQDYFHKRLQKEGATKAKYIVPKSPREKELPELMSADITKKHLLDVIVATIDSTCYFGRTEFVPDHDGFMRRDLERPVQNPMISMPPKLARILVNLTGVKPRELLLDPFCGIGTILQEAMMIGADIRGVDISREMVEATIRNLEWLSYEFKVRLSGIRQKIILGDTRHLDEYFIERSIDCIATEPILIPPLKEFVSEDTARKLLRKSQDVYAEALISMGIVLKRGGRAAIVTPYVRTRARTLKSFDTHDLATKAGLRSYRSKKLAHLKWPFFPRGAGDEKVARGIFLFEKT